MIDFTKFLIAQTNDYAIALKEIRYGKKITHWMWYIFPQIKGLGHSEMSHIYAIPNLEAAKQYLKHPVLGYRLLEISHELLKHKGKDIVKIFGEVDAMKLKSSMTLFSEASNLHEDVFKIVIDTFFNGEKDHLTLKRISDTNS